MKVWEEVFKEEGWVGKEYKMPTPCYELMYMYIKPEEREKGMGSKLFDQVVSFTNDEGVRAIYAYVGDKLPAALNFYQKKGAVVIKDLSDGDNSNAFLEYRVK